MCIRDSRYICVKILSRLFENKEMERHGTNLISVEAFRTNFLFFTLRIFQKLLWYLLNSFTLVLTICMPLLHLDSLFSTEPTDTNYDWFLNKLTLISNTIYNLTLGCCQ